MFLLFLIVTASIIGFFLIPLHIFGLVIGFGIITGCLVRGLYLLHEINSKLDKQNREEQ
ncbi:hypothetical protein B0G93_101320 [Bacillus sp. V-88]|uniref:Uncharacterized protein n=1 Tax=Rossellomorea vietnamensis TaxID=218284 RepID=A0A6I6UMF8_9BACI|nr:hypothetical protein [Rossellomorea vietnamensis]PRX79570.1 hypothetical protein B0G93_101320 [Bacillus sp. V-88]QHE60211.1 hypothetical protein FHE72_03550 [Rossellomorea vietnamensis]SLJ98065.1 hypothetical protein SAMN06295884_101320 [Bacillus sp. V-88]